ncbi:thiamine pyrophosphate-binding protein [Anaeromyxobacter paludicola]|uniref:Acetolactate synthase n=1 Tax=Anaeromyxobacter paludicola TaxID=2918171 RepID=A0ABM7X5S4_9BACT|nr:thiamine pyrophosphate-binding protein [Anaeromyxobacter paludicola]BDG07167.1 acetolactate synthase [Anaeromyxobacter paludicola]
MKMRVADYLTDQLYRAGGERVFLITGGMIMHLTDALLKHERQQYVACHHEAAAVMAADAYGRFTGKLGVAYVTAGPGALNTLTGVVGAWVDTAPCIIVAGQSKVSQAKVTGPRQFALQGFNTLPIFSQVTKYAVMLDDVRTVRYQVERAIHEATTARVGPVWIEVPVDIQGATFDPDEHPGFTPPAPELLSGAALDEKVREAAELLRSARRPVILAGAGVRLANAVQPLLDFARRTNVPVLTSRLGMDLIGDDDRLFAGRPGTYGDRPGNFAVQNADVLLTIGCRLGIGLVGYDYQGFARRAKKIMVDVDPRELDKPAVVPDLPIRADAAAFLERISPLVDRPVGNPAWLEQIQTWRRRYPVDEPSYAAETKGINSYHFTRLLSERMPADAVFVLDTGSCFHVHAQAFQVKAGQRHIITGGLSTMGYVPAVVGVAAAHEGRDVYCVTGDGSLQMHLQELQTIKHHAYPVKLMVFNNDGYLLIRHTQKNFMEGRYIGESPRTGVSFPDLRKLADLYGMHYVRIGSEAEVDGGLAEVMAHHGPVLCEVITPAEQLLAPRVASKKLDDGSMISMPYDDMFPFLPREEYAENQVWDRIT